MELGGIVNVLDLDLENLADIQKKLKKNTE
jgi:hypothetical protein